jgi:tetratricopeptide (TPR) repeat protein
MKKLSLVVVALVVAALGVVLLLRRVGSREKSSVGESLAVAQGEPELPPWPDISLQIDREHELTVYQGTPLLFSVRLANHRAMNAAQGNHARQACAEGLKAAVARGAIPKERADALLANLQRTEPIRAVQLGDDTAAWDTFVRFAQLTPDGKPQPLGWPLKALGPAQSKTLRLDGETTAQLDWALDPTTALAITPGEYQIVAVLEVPAEAKLAAERWRGRTQSDPVKLSVKEKPAQFTKADEENFNLSLARYYDATGDARGALQYAEKALAANPKSIPASILVGEVREGLGDLKGALEGYKNAQHEFYQQYPNSYEAPLYLIDRTISVTEKLEEKEPR